MLFSVKPQHESAIHMHTFPPFWTSLSSPSPSHPSRLVQSPFEFPEPYSKFPLAIYFTYGNISFHVTPSIHLTLSCPLPLSISRFSMSVSPLLPCKLRDPEHTGSCLIEAFRSHSTTCCHLTLQFTKVKAAHILPSVFFFQISCASPQWKVSSDWHSEVWVAKERESLACFLWKRIFVSQNTLFVFLGNSGSWLSDHSVQDSLQIPTEQPKTSSL